MLSPAAWLCCVALSGACGMWVLAVSRSDDCGVITEGLAGPHLLLPHHAHNSEEAPGGLLGALQAGFCSIEVDIHPRSTSQLLVGHDSGRHGETLQAMYLEPLAERVEVGLGWVYPHAQYLGSGVCRGVTLVVDVKEIPGQSPENSFDFVHNALSQFAEEHPGVLSSWSGDTNEAVPGPVSIMISGDRPAASHLFGAYPDRRLAILDGREGDLDAGLPLSFMPIISKAWFEGGKAVLHGINPLRRNNRQAAETRALVERAHRQGRLVRFWGHRDNPAGWQEMLDLGVDQLSIDDFVGFSRWITTRAAAGHEQAARKIVEQGGARCSPSKQSRRMLQPPHYSSAKLLRSVLG